MVSVSVKDEPIDYAIDNFAVTVVKWPVTERIEQRGGEKSEAYSSTTEISGYFHRYKQDWTFDKEGKIEGGDAIFLVKNDVTVAKNDKIVTGGETFKIQNIITRYVQGTARYKACNLFLYD